MGLLMTTASTQTGMSKHWLFGPMAANKSTYMQVGFAALMINVFSLVTSLFSMVVYNTVVPNDAKDSLLVLSIGVMLVLVFDFILRSLRGYFIDIAGHRIDSAVGASIYRRVLDMRLADKRGSTGSFAGLLREFESLRDFFASATLAAIVDVPFIAIFLVVIGSIGGKLVWIPIAVIPIVIIVGLVIQPILSRLSSTSMAQGLTKQGVMVETLSGLETVKSTSGAAVLEERWQQAVDGHADVARKQRGYSQIGTNVASSLQQVAYVGMIFYGVYLLHENQITMGGMIACSLLVGRCLAPLAQIAQLLSRLSHTRIAYQQLDKMMRQDGETRDGVNYLRRAKIHGGISFRNVIFRYPGSTVRAIDDVSFDIQPGEKVAILGRIGSGKSTITRIILGLYEPTEGAVLIDDTDVRQIHPQDLRQNIGAVLQDVFLLSGTIRENIALRDPKASDDEILRVSRLSGAHDFVGQIPNGYDVKLADRGEGLSGGQKQSLAIARAMLGAPPIVLLDEPTSAMDTNTENALLSRLETEFKDRTLLLVTHRASLLKLVDRVIIMDRGKIVAQGPRDDVLRASAVGNN
jgi:ATP-binding cassette, subfamily C, bacterial LapB